MTCSVNKKKCVYTALTGGYDNLIQPDYIAEDYDYICFSNDITSDRFGVWEIRPIPFEHKDNKRLAMYAKMHPHTLLEKYDFCIWIDANNLIKDDFIYKKAESLFAEGHTIGHIVHPFRDCIYRELFACMHCGADSTWRLVKTLFFLLRNDYPFRAGLFENNCIFWSHHKVLVKEALDMFWDVYMHNSRRDQLSLGYVYYKLDIHPALLLPVGEDMRNSTHIERVDHTDKDKRNKFAYKKYRINMMKIRLVRTLFRLMGYNLSH